MRPRALDLEDLIEVLLKEHEEVRALLKRINALLQNGRYGELAEELNKFKPYLDQHVIDEEASVLKVLIDTYGREGADRFIRVFQEHREIHRLLQDMRRIAVETPERLAELKTEFSRVLERHFMAEESDVFPSALRVMKGKRG
ncbi:MAG: hemerythrin domain-containing protein [Nitrososphaerota archaeon]|nr:hemerythrin domain-containing protein [Nitrososphaerota archaeon]